MLYNIILLISLFESASYILTVFDLFGRNYCIADIYKSKLIA